MLLNRRHRWIKHILVAVTTHVMPRYPIRWLVATCLVAVSGWLPASALAGNGRIAFVNADKGIYDIQMDGTGLRALAPAPGYFSGPTWSPDGTKLAYVKGSSGYYTTWDIYTVNSDGSGTTAVVSSPQEDSEPAWSPDGTKLVFVSARDGNREIYVAGAGGENQTRLTSDQFGDRDPAWSPDGSQIAFASDRFGDLEIMTMAADGSNQTRITTLSGSDTKPRWSSDGQSLTFFHGAQLYSVPSAGGMPIATGAVRHNLSPDGLVYADIDHDGHLSAVNADGTCLRTFSPYGTEPIWQFATPGTPGPLTCPENDADGDGIINASDPDDDNDGVVDTSDNCPNAPKSDQADHDGDGLGDACDDDDDGDGVIDVVDHCPLAVGPVLGASYSGCPAAASAASPVRSSTSVASGADLAPVALELLTPSEQQRLRIGSLEFSWRGDPTDTFAIYKAKGAGLGASVVRPTSGGELEDGVAEIDGDRGEDGAYHVSLRALPPGNYVWIVEGDGANSGRKARRTFVIAPATLRHLNVRVQNRVGRSSHAPGSSLITIKTAPFALARLTLRHAGKKPTTSIDINARGIATVRVKWSCQHPGSYRYLVAVKSGGDSRQGRGVIAGAGAKRCAAMKRAEADALRRQRLRDRREAQREPTSSAPSPSPHKPSCVPAKIGGFQQCLRVGDFCDARWEADYNYHGFTCEPYTTTDYDQGASIVVTTWSLRKLG